MKLELPQGVKPRFALGRLLATPSALAALILAEISPGDLLKRHVEGDWGDVTLHDWRENEFSVKADLRLLSSYMLKTNVRVWVITEADRSITTLLLPDEY
ncbi:hypothetical protein [Paraburkholderia sp. ZP32-5]|uniref:hypothetical protein n=1 Tax=Paraburkholderia sp. ZP32-5 TaxID=2883245 RepID=UPI001F1E1F90|nr:hypothetical protein [Paraburkholderia sp. ZP32-5]